MQLRYSFRLYPDHARRSALSRAFGCAPAVFNDALRAREDTGAAGERYPSACEPSKKLITQLITQAKQTAARSWLGEVSAVVLRQSPRDAEVARENFFASLKGERKGPGSGTPRFTYGFPPEARAA